MILTKKKQYSHIAITFILITQIMNKESVPKSVIYLYMYFLKYLFVRIYISLSEYNLEMSFYHIKRSFSVTVTYQRPTRNKLSLGRKRSRPTFSDKKRIWTKLTASLKKKKCMSLNSNRSPSTPELNCTWDVMFRRSNIETKHLPTVREKMYVPF